MLVPHLQTETSEPSGCLRPIYSTTQADLSERPMSGLLYSLFDYGFRFHPFHSSKKMQSFILPLCQAHLFLFRFQMSLVCSIRLPGEAHLWWADGLYRSPAANHSAQRPPGADGSRFLTSFLISARTPWALIHESCSDIRLIYAALISLTLRGVWRDETGILMFDANLSRWFHWKEHWQGDVWQIKRDYTVVVLLLLCQLLRFFEKV